MRRFTAASYFSEWKLIDRHYPPAGRGWVATAQP